MAKEPLRGLLSSKAKLMWMPEHDEAFEHIKTVMQEPPTLAFFRPYAYMELWTDASKLNGMGFVLLQRQKSGEMAIIECGSRFLSPAEKNYAVVELEAAAAAWAVEKLRVYLVGHPGFQLVVDHKPLVGILDGSGGPANNQRLLRIRSRLANYSFTTV